MVDFLMCVPYLKGGGRFAAHYVNVKLSMFVSVPEAMRLSVGGV